MTTDGEVTFAHLCQIILEEGSLRQNHGDPDVRNYHRRMLAVLVEDFGIEWKDRWDPVHFRSRGLPTVLRSMFRSFLGTPHPYSSYLEYIFLRDEEEIWLRHKSRFGNDEAIRRQAWYDLFHDLMLLRWPEAAHSKSTWRCVKEQIGDQPASRAARLTQ